jgi:hypothetical protein
MPVHAQQGLNGANQKPDIVGVSILVEQEGPGALFAQAGKDLSKAEIDKLRSLIVAEVTKLPNHKIVPHSAPDLHTDLSVVAEKIGPRGNWIIISSAITIGGTSGKDEMMSHDVIAERSLATAAHAVAYYLLALELRGALGGIKPN